MTKLKSAGHHWWPEALSQHWKDENGGVTWLKPTGETVVSVPKKFGVIGNGHAIKLSQDPTIPSPWDESYESAFQAADDSWPSLISWLENLSFERRPAPRRFLTQVASDEQIARLVEALVSLAVRSPTTREAAAGLADRFAAPMSTRARNNVIGLNLRNAQANLTRAIGVRGKFVVLHSPDREFIFGDGFGHNLTHQHQLPLNPRLLAPLTPRLAVLWTCPMSYRPDPRLTTLVLDADEARLLNDIVQVYAKDMLFYRNDPPERIKAFTAAQHLVFADHDNTLQRLIHMVPGVPPPDPELENLRRFFQDRDREGAAP
jgi:hypothetical protein